MPTAATAAAAAAVTADITIVIIQSAGNFNNIITSETVTDVWGWGEGGDECECGAGDYSYLITFDK